jgi:hypothetical protein
MVTNCCRFFIGVVRGRHSPFARLLATRYYDGPTEGLVECGSCGTTYSFQKLDWDDQQDIRIFSLSPISGRGLDDLMRSPGSPLPKWPNWILTSEESADFAAKVDELRKSASPEEFIVVTEDLLREVGIWRPVGLGVHRDWFSELGLPRKGPSA